MSAARVPFEWLDDVEVARRWPQWRLDAGTRAIFQANGGIADPDRRHHPAIRPSRGRDNPTLRGGLHP